MSRDTAAAEFAARLRALKERSGLSYGVLAKRLHMSTSTLHRYCNGDAVPAEYAPVERLARLCRASPAELVELHRSWVLADAVRGRKGAAGDDAAPAGAGAGAGAPAGGAATSGASAVVGGPGEDTAAGRREADGGSSAGGQRAPGRAEAEGREAGASEPGDPVTETPDPKASDPKTPESDTLVAGSPGAGAAVTGMPVTGTSQSGPSQSGPSRSGLSRSGPSGAGTSDTGTATPGTSPSRSGPSGAEISETGTATPGTSETRTPEAGTPTTGAPTPVTPDTGISTPGAPTTVTPDTVTPDTVTPDTVTPDTGIPTPGAPTPVTPGTGAPTPGTPTPGAPVGGAAPGAGNDDAGVPEVTGPGAGGSRPRPRRRTRTAVLAGIAVAAVLGGVTLALGLPDGGDGGGGDRKGPAGAASLDAGAGRDEDVSASPSASPSSSPSASPSAKDEEAPRAPAAASTTPADDGEPDAVPLTAQIDPYVWESPCEQRYLINRPVSEVKPPPTEQDAPAWVSALGAVSSGEQYVRLTVQGTGDETVVVKGLTVRVAGKRSPLAWNDFAMGYPGVGCGGGVPTRSFTVALDAARPALTPEAGHRDFPFKVSESDPEIYYIAADASAYDVSWYLELEWSSGSRSGTLTLDDKGRPFHTSGNNGRPAYEFPLGGEKWVPEGTTALE